MRRRRLAWGLLAVLVTCVGAGAWISAPLLLSFENIETKIRKFVNNRGYEIEIGVEPRLVMTPFPEIALGKIWLTRADGKVVLEGKNARLAPSPWMLLSADALAGTFNLSDARIQLPETAISAPVNLEDTALVLRLGASGDLGGRFNSQLDEEAVVGDFGISELDALLEGRVSTLALDLTVGARVAAFEGTVRLPPKAALKPVPHLVGRLSIEGLDTESVAIWPWAADLLREMPAIDLTSRINLNEERLSVVSLLSGSLRDHPASVAATLTGGPRWVDTGVLQGEMIARLGGVLSAQVVGHVDWRNPAKSGVEGDSQLVVLNLPLLADWSSLSDLARGPLPMSVNLKGGVRWNAGEIAITDGTFSSADNMYTGDARLNLGADRPELSIRSALPRLAWPGIEPLLEDLRVLSSLAVDLVLEVDAEAFSVDPIAAIDAEVLMRGTPAVASLEIRSAKLADGNAAAKLTLDRDRAAVAMELNGTEFDALFPGALTGAVVGDIRLAWDTAAMDKMAGEGSFSVYAGSLTGVDVDAALLGTEPRDEATDFAVMVTDVRMSDGVLAFTPLRISGAGWAAEGYARLDTADRTVSGILRTARSGDGGDLKVGVSGTFEELSLVVSGSLAAAAPANEPANETPESETVVPALTEPPAAASKPTLGILDNTPTAEADTDATEAAQEDTPAKPLSATPPIPLRPPR